MLTHVCRRPFDEDHDAFRDSVRRFVAQEIEPELDRWRRGNGAPIELWTAAAEQGLLGTGIPEEHGGGGAPDPLFVAVLVEEAMAVGAVGIAWLLAVQEGIAVPLLGTHGSPDQQARWLPSAAAGKTMIVALPYSATMAAETIADGVRLTGEAAGVVGFDGPATFLVRFRQDEREGIAIVSSDLPGVRVTRIADSLGGRDAAQVDVSFAGVAVGAADLILPEPSTFAGWRGDCYLWGAVAATAGADAVLGLTLDYVGGRKVFGRPLSVFENTRYRLAEVISHMVTARTLVDRLLEERVAGAPAPAVAAIARMCAAVARDEAVDRGMQLHGGYGYMREYPISTAYADARFLRQQELLVAEARDDVATELGL